MHFPNKYLLCEHLAHSAALFRTPYELGFLFTFQTGSATAIGEQPIKCLVNAGCGARMTVGEALTNLVFAKITDIKVKHFKVTHLLTVKCQWTYGPT